ncbi:MAG: prephenate dehydratase domain-containing protein [Myxococcota bacterium]
MSSNDDLKAIRTRLDALDRGLVQALAERDQLVQDVAQLKAEGTDFIRDRNREEELLTRVVAEAQQHGLSSEYITRLFRDILDHSVRRQQRLVSEMQEETPHKTLRVVYQGTEGSYSRVASGKHFASYDGAVQYTGLPTFQDVVDAVCAGDAEYAVLPVENTTAGSINETYDLLARHDLAQVGEEVHTIEHCVLAVDQVPLSHIRRIYSQVQALAQCTDFLGQLEHCQAISYTDTAMSCVKIRDDQDLSQAAIASEEAARLYGLHVIKRNIANQKENFTRFAVVGLKAVQYDRRIPCKTSLVLATRHEQGALLQCMAVLARHQLNLTKLESRPRPGVPWEYLFYVDFEGNLADPNVQSAMQQLKAHTSTLKTLGSYPARNTAQAQPATPRLPQPDTPQTPIAPQVPTPEPLHLIEQRPYRLASRSHRTKDTTIKVGEVIIGNGPAVWVAGPQLIASRAHLTTCAQAARQAGAHLLQGGCFTQAASPYAFQGLGHHGLELLQEIGREVGMPTMTEVLHPSDVDVAARHVDLLRVGGAQMNNFALLQALGRVDRPVVLGRASMASLDEWLAAAETILARGNQQVILLEQGIRTFETSARRTLDLSAIPLVRQRTHLPLLVDPSLACTHPSHIQPLARAALAAGAQGLMFMLDTETHHDDAQDSALHLDLETWHALAPMLRTDHA